MVNTHAKLDPVDYAIISQSLIAAAREMGAKLIRSAYSTVLREARDGSAALLDAFGNTIAQAELIPIQLGTIGHVFRTCSELYPNETLEPGDFFIINDPYSGGQHLQDIFLFHPIFVDGTVVGFSASVAHHLDISGGDPGLNIAAPDIYAEGLILPPLKLNMQRDWHGGAFERLIRANVRVPHQTMGDFDAQIAANSIGAQRVSELANRYGVQKLVAVMAALLDYSEARMRSALKDIPDGIYIGEDAIDDDGIGNEPLPIRVKVTIKGDTAEIDFEGTAAQVRRNLNAPFAATVSAALCCLKAALTSPDIPFNGGAFRPITVSAPKGSILNPNHPAPVRARLEVCSRAWNAIMKALSQAVPTKVISCGFDTTTSFVLSHLGEKGWSVYLEVFGGGFGAANDTDGCDAVDNPLSNCSNTPVEALDQDFSFFRVIDYSLRTDSGGKGFHRGGLGFTRSFEVLADNVRVSLYSDRFRRPAEGLFGGGEGATGFCRVVRNGEIIDLRSKDAFDLEAGDVVILGVGGGGGYGKPEERPRAAIAHDLEDRLISPESAENWFVRSA
ncbi:hydantoinase B/oxoprolinase family protein [Rhizobium leguminosarum]|uniref:hydantoinase B/oxoprolinase family protein n=1 Tax=Rhizobium leguminosarum TaxID=384 RepID=UPI001C9523F8|nr:hydantoinase B/oxoprolinase family protein [Rhizobium leguminosarum]MBY5533707.1 hydantoinase B/oxoprolinase family protein [Rhizobium leguminosarum]